MLKYIEEKNYQNYRNYKYKNVYSGITYRYLWSPIDDFLVQFLPYNLAPNTITTATFFMLSVVHVIFLLGCQYGRPIQTWRLIMMAISLILYQHLDNLDGKQARRTKSSSPFGMILDHGADALSSSMITVQTMEILQYQSGTLKIWILFTTTMLVYFWAMWAQYSTGIFTLGDINPVDQGLPLYAIFTIFSIFVPYTSWNTEHFFGTYNQVVVYCFYAMMFPIAFSMIKNNYKDAIIPKSHITKALILPISFTFALIMLSFHQQKPLQSAYWPVFYSLLFSWAQNMSQIQICEVVKQEFNPLNLGTISFLIPTLIFFIVNVEASIYFTGVAIISGLIFAAFTVSFTMQSAEVLKIRIFSIEKANVQ